MTKEEAKGFIVRSVKSDVDIALVADAIKALEEEDVLDKIRAEIEQNAMPNEIGGRGNGKSIRYGLCKALEIINIISNTKQSSSEIPISSTTKSVSLDVYNQVVKERDIAIEQLHELGYEFGEKIEPTTKKDCNTCTHNNETDGSNCYECVKDMRNNYEPTTKNNLAVDPIDRVELLRAMDTWDKFGFTTRYGLERLDKDDKGFVPYVKYDDMLKCVKGMSSVTSIRPKGHWIEHEHNGKSYIECSECLCWFLRTHLLRNSHCPNCGSRNGV